ncbi:MAG: exonuclease domain-containing protein [Candidatus Competibacter sp.]|nr:exonuclease domain-containing protein [Candidatus Competibacter sp.]MDG4583720.1 exonuclease domain-containing protein [Candidatus Competibacter sp.]
MNDNLKVALALVAFLALVAGLEVLADYAFFHALASKDQHDLTAMLAPRTELLLELGALRMGILGAAFVVAYRLYVKGALKVAEGIRIMLKAHSGHRIEPAGPPEVRQLASAVNELAEHSERLARDLEAEVARATSSLEEEKNRLAALMSELSQGVLVCNIDGRILLYNERARQVLGTSANPRNGGTCTLIGLGRSIFALVDRSLLTHALESVLARLAKDDPDPNVQFVISTRAEQLVRVQLAPVLAVGRPASDPGARIGGFVMTLENITRAFDLDTTRDMLLHSFTEGSRAALASIRAAVETLMHYPDCERAQRDCFIQIIGEETRKLSAKLHQLTVDHADSLKTRWPLEEMSGLDVIAAAQRRIENRLGVPTEVEAADDTLWLRVDSYTLAQALASLAGRLRDHCGVGKLRFHLSRHGRIAELDLAWPGPPLSQQALHDWEMDPMSASGEDSPLTLRDVLERHGAEIVYMAERDARWPRFRFLLPMAKPVRFPQGAPIRYGESRPEFYDFDLFHQAGQTPELDDTPLAELAFTVFDTETTGLDPAAGDEIIAIGAVRIVNNRLLRYETYEQLVDPKRPIASMSQTIHGITHDMLRGQPLIDAVLPQFHEYCADTVLVGHNAAFDLRFLQMKEARTGVRFTQPVLDTLLLSEVVHPNQPSHALEAIAERLGVTVVARHTALGDALVTGEVFLRMLPLLAANGIRTLRDAREAAEKIYVKVNY